MSNKLSDDALDALALAYKVYDTLPQLRAFWDMSADPVLCKYINSGRYHAWQRFLLLGVVLVVLTAVIGVLA